MKEVLIAIITSLIASIIFWLVFSLIPERRRYNKVRPKVEFDIYEIFLSLRSFINIALIINEYGWMFSDRKIELGEVTKDDFNIWLQNKCLNSSYKFDEMGSKMLEVGDDLESTSNRIVEKIETCATYYSFMTADEILLLRKISARVKSYSYTGSAADKVGETTFLPVVPNITYMAENFAELSRIYIELRKIVWSYKKIDRTINKYIVSDFSYSNAVQKYKLGEYAKCVRLAKKAKYVSESTKQELIFKAYYKSGNREKAEKALRQYCNCAKTKSPLINGLVYDTQVEALTIDDWVEDILFENISDYELVEALNSAERRQAIEDDGIRTAEEIKTFYNKKLEENDKKASMRLAKKKAIFDKAVEEMQKIDSSQQE